MDLFPERKCSISIRNVLIIFLGHSLWLLGHFRQLLKIPYCINSTKKSKQTRIEMKQSLKWNFSGYVLP